MLRQYLPAAVIVLAGCNKRKIVNMSVQRVGAGDSARLVHVFQDCADLRTMEQRLLQSERLATVGRFASQIAHEIRNPLNSVSMGLQRLKGEFAPRQDQDQYSRFIELMQGEVRRLNSIVEQFLSLARPLAQRSAPVAASRQ